MFDAAYGEEAPSKQGIVAKCGLNSKETPARKSHKSTCVETQALVPSSSAGGFQMPMPTPAQIQQWQMTMMMFQQMSQGGHAGSPFGLQVFQKDRQQKAFNRAPKALADAQAESQTDFQGEGAEEAEMETPPGRQSMFALPAPAPSNKSPAEQVEIMANSLKAKEMARRAENEEKKAEEDEKVKKPAAAKGKAKAKAKGKPEAKVEAKAKAKASAKAKATAKAKAEAEATAMAKAETEPKAKKPKFAFVEHEGPVEDQVPPEQGDGTFHWRGGKIHRNEKTSCWRVFLRRTDKVDKKIRFIAEDLRESFHRALRLIEEADKNVE